MPSFIIEREIRTIDSKICRHIDNISVAPRGIVAQDVLSDLRHFVEHIMLFNYANGRDLDDKGNVISCDVFSTYRDGKPIGKREFLWVDTKTCEYHGVE